MASAERVALQASFARFGEGDRAVIMSDLGEAIAALDRVDDALTWPGYADLRRTIVNFYLDLLAIRLRPFDQEVVDQALE